jgi:hypothetical protein
MGVLGVRALPQLLPCRGAALERKAWAHLRCSCNFYEGCTWVISGLGEKGLEGQGGLRLGLALPREAKMSS